MIDANTCCCGGIVLATGTQRLITVDLGGNTARYDTNSGASIDTLGTLNGNGYFDWKNENFYSVLNGATPYIVRISSDLAVADQIFLTSTTGGRQVLHLAVNPLLEYIYYSETRAGASDLRRVNYDGSNDTLLVNYQSTSTTPHMRVSKFEGYVFIGDQLGIKRCDSDGTNLTTIYTSGGPAVRGICVDNENKYLFWNEVSGTTTTIKRAAFDGSGVASLITSIAGVPPLVASFSGNTPLEVMGWSHKDQLLYLVLWTGSSLSPDSEYAGLGFYSCRSDGTDLKEVAIDPNILNDPAGTQHHSFEDFRYVMGTGFDDVGATTKAS